MTNSHDIVNALTSGINSEVTAYVFYFEAIKKVSDPDLKAILRTLALEEKNHFRLLERKWDSQVRSEMWVMTADVLNQDGLPEIDAEMTTKHKALIAEIDQSSTNRQVLEMALRLEEEARDLFLGLAETVESDDAKAVFKQLSGFEEGHVKIVQDLIVKYA
jgi:rubrerythrin